MGTGYKAIRQPITATERTFYLQGTIDALQRWMRLQGNYIDKRDVLQILGIEIEETSKNEDE